MTCKLYVDDPALSADERDVRRQVRGLRRFYKHLAVFLVVNGLLFGINILAGPNRAWFQWPLMGWSILLALHGVATLLRGHWLGAAWEERKYRQLLAERGVK